jgi:transglutaminase-like putative cysteine protease
VRLALLHRRLSVGMGLAGLLAFAGGAGFEPLSTLLAAAALLLALFWHPTPGGSRTLERLWLPLAALLVVRALAHVFFLGGDVVIPVVDLLLLLLCAEALRSLDARNDARLYALSFALMLAATAYRPGLLFAAAFVSYLVVGTVALTVGHLRRAAEEHREGVPTPGPGFLAGTAALSLVVLATSAAVFLTFPRVSRAWSGRGDAMATSIAGFSDRISLGEHGATIHGNPEVVLRVEFPGGRPADPGALHWRGRSYDHFDGVTWSRSDGIRTSLGPTDWYRRWGDSLIVQRIYGAPLDVRVLFALHPTIAVESSGRIHPLFDNVGDYVYWGNGQPVYTATSVASRPSPDALREAESGYMPDRTHYLQLPRLPDRIPALADSLTRGLRSRYDRVVAIERWLRGEFEYTLDLPATAREASLDHFLFQRKAGHCEYFSSAMVVLLRTLGIHARNVNGFLGGSWSDFGEYLVVTQNEAHSWVEVWFPGYGWVSFDPTPAAAAGGTRSTSWLWPGRFLLDGLQHRWNKWVLDYDIGSQSELLERFFGDRSRPSRGTGDDGPAREWSWPLALVLLAAAGVAGLSVARGLRRGVKTETRLYLGLLRACREAGVGRGAVGPLELVEELAAAGHPARAPAQELVDRYVRVRFGRDEMDDDARASMRRALSAARSALRHDRRDRASS